MNFLIQIMRDLNFEMKMIVARVCVWIMPDWYIHHRVTKMLRKRGIEQ